MDFTNFIEDGTDVMEKDTKIRYVYQLCLFYKEYYVCKTVEYLVNCFLFFNKNNIGYIGLHNGKKERKYFI